jgi:hypothetical protein
VQACDWGLFGNVWIETLQLDPLLILLANTKLPLASMPKFSVITPDVSCKTKPVDVMPVTVPEPVDRFQIRF